MVSNYFGVRKMLLIASSESPHFRWLQTKIGDCLTHKLSFYYNGIEILLRYFLSNRLRLVALVPNSLNVARISAASPKGISQ